MKQALFAFTILVTGLISTAARADVGGNFGMVPVSTDATYSNGAPIAAGEQTGVGTGRFDWLYRHRTGTWADSRTGQVYDMDRKGVLFLSWGRRTPVGQMSVCPPSSSCAPQSLSVLAQDATSVPICGYNDSCAPVASAPPPLAAPAPVAVLLPPVPAPVMVPVPQNAHATATVQQNCVTCVVQTVCNYCQVIQRRRAVVQQQQISVQATFRTADAYSCAGDCGVAVAEQPAVTSCTSTLTTSSGFSQAKTASTTRKVWFRRLWRAWNC